MPRNFDLRKGFISQSVRNTEVFDPTFDEPTYLSFRIKLYSDDFTYQTKFLSYDELPQGLFCNEQATNSENIYLNFLAEGAQRTMAGFEAANAMRDRPYSAVQYLLTKNEDYRAWCLAKFIEGFNDIQFYAPHFIQGISGIGDLFKTTPDKGWGIDKNALIKITCLESLDERIKYLMSLYRTAVWDNRYQRFILPDIFRMFKMDIYISEIRSFHISNMVGTGSFQDTLTNILFNTGISIGGKSYSVNSLLSSAIGKVNEATHGLINNNTRIDPLSLSILDGICPVTCLHCEMCDFDVRENLFGNELKVDNTEMEQTQFTVRVKKAEVYHHWLIRGHTWISDLGSRSERESGPSPVIQSMKEMGHDWFTGDMYLAENDRTHSYTQTIETGGIANGLKKLAGGLSTATSFLDVAADIYNGFKEAKNAYDAASDKKIKSKATKDDNEISAGAFLQYVGENSKANTENKEVINLLKNSMKSYSVLAKEQQQVIEQYYDKLKNEVRGLLAEKSANMGDRSTATDFDGGPGNLEKEIVSANEKHLGTLTSLDSNIDRSKSTNFDGGPDGAKSLTPVNSNIDRSKATDFDGEPGKARPLVPNHESPLYTDDNDFSAATLDDNWRTHNLTDVNSNVKSPIDGSIADNGMKQDGDRSEATDLDGGPDGTLTPNKYTGDRSLATDFDGGPEGSLTPLDSSIDRSQATDFDGGPEGSSNLTPNIHPGDRSLATNFDGGPDGSLTPNVHPGDRSLATDFDGGPDGSANLTSNSHPGDRSLATDLDGSQDTELTPNVHPGDRSLATDFDGEPNGNLIPNSHPGDRSLATDLDDEPEGELIPIPQIDDRSLATDLDGIDPGEMLHVEQPEDRSWATDLDGQEIGDGTLVPMIPDEDDRSLATDLDGQEDAELVPNIHPGDRSLATDLDDEPEGELIPVPQIEDRSLSTDLDGIESAPTVSIPQDTYVAEENLIPNFNYGDRSLATDLDDEPDGELIPVPQAFQKNSEPLIPNRVDVDRSLATDLDDEPDGEPVSLFEQYAKQVKSRSTSFQKIDGGSLRPEFEGKTVADVIQMVAELKDEADKLRNEKLEKIINDDVPEKDERIEKVLMVETPKQNPGELVENKPKETSNKDNRKLVL